MPNDDDVKRARELALKAARNDPDRHNYTASAHDPAWEPHRWVVNAIAEALQIGQVKLGQRATELLDHIVAPVREQHARTAGLLAEALKRIETLERAIPYGPEEPLGALLSSHRQRLEEHERSLAAQRKSLDAFRQTLEGMSMTLGEQNQRANALALRVDQLESGRTGKSPIAFLKPHHRPRAQAFPELPEAEQAERAGFTGPDAVVRFRRWTGKPDAAPPAFVHPDHMTTITENAADNGDPMALGIMALTKERDTYRGQLHRLGRWMRGEGPIVGREHRRIRGEESDAVIDAVIDAAIATMVDLSALVNTLARVTKERDAARADVEQYLKGERQHILDQRERLSQDLAVATTDLENVTKVAETVKECQARQVGMIRERDTALASSDLCIAEQRREIDRLTVELASIREGGQRAHDDSAQMRQALATASKERDNAYRAADKAKAQRDGVRSTVIDQAREISELRAQLRATEGQLRIVETTAKTLAGENAEAKAERTRGGAHRGR